MSMGDHNGSARSGGQAFDAELDDPFEELARILESPLMPKGAPDKVKADPAVAPASPTPVIQLQTPKNSAAQVPVPAVEEDSFDVAEMSAALSLELANALDLAATDFSSDEVADAADVASTKEQTVAVAAKPAPVAQPAAAAPKPAAAAPKPIVAGALPSSPVAAPKPAAAPAPAPTSAAKAEPVAAPAVQSPPIAVAPAAPAVVAKPQAPAAGPVVQAASPMPAATAPVAPRQQPAAAAKAPFVAPMAPALASAPQTLTPDLQTSAAEPVAGFDREFELALRGLSEPANPRQPTIHQSEAFAPDRQPAVADATASDDVFDDFDELIASELAAIKQDIPDRHADEEEGAEDETFDSSQWPLSFEAGGEGQVAGVERSDVRGSRPNAALASRSYARRGRFVGLGLGALVLMLAGGGAYFVMGSGPGTASDGSVLIVRADADPVKVKPENPGGREIPNQNKMVYSRAETGGAVVTPEQKQLVSAQEKPIALPTETPSPSDLPGVEIGIGAANAAEGPTETAQSADVYSESSPIAVLSPRRVKTYSVRADGTLVFADAPTQAAEDQNARGPLIDAASRPVSMPQADDLQGAEVSTAEPADVAEAGAVEMAIAGVPAPEIPVPTLRPSVGRAEAPRPVAEAPAAPQIAAQPAAQETRADEIQTAALQPQPAAPVAVEPAAEQHDGYYVQISSQPSRDAAEASSRNLGQRYNSVIAGRNVIIQSADIPGKGTYYRVRVPVESKTEGARLCGDLKSSGGSCFVSR